MEEEKEIQISKYSSGVNIIIRIDSLWRLANSSAIAGLFNKWNTVLDVIWRELARDVDGENYKDKKEKFDKFDERLKDTGQFKDTGSDTFKAPDKEMIDKRAEQYKILNEKELFLKRLENELGKGTTFDDGDEDDFE